MTVKETATERRRRLRTRTPGDEIELLTYDEIAELLRVSSKTVQRLVAAKRLEAFRIGRRVMFDKSKALEALRR